MNLRSIATVALIAACTLGASAAKPRKSKPAAKVAAVVPDSTIHRAERLAKVYRLDEGSQLLENIGGRLSDSDQAHIDSLRSYIVDLRNMLERVEKIELIDSLQLPLDRFFMAYPLQPDAGRLTLGTGRDSDRASMAYIPAGEREIFWTATDKKGRSQIFTASILDDGTVDAPQALNLLPGFETAYPFLMPDGENLYFAARPVKAADDNTVNIGGYDLYLCRRQTDGTYTTPQNLGLPYNSPANDYLFAIDETTGTGFFASDRNSPAGKVTVYAFRPNATRVNYASDTPGLSDIALLRTALSSASADSKPGSVFRKAEAQQSAQTTDAQLFSIAVNGRVYTRLNQFQNPDARTAMTAVIGAERELAQLNNHIDKLRADYRAGRHDLRGDILSAERHRSNLVKELRTLRNRVIQLER